MIGNVFQPMRTDHALFFWPANACLEDNLVFKSRPDFFNPYGRFFSSFKDAFEVVLSLRSQGYRAVVKVTNPNYTI